MTRFAAILLILLGAHAEAAPVKILRYVSQRPDKAYLREGPTYAHKVLWVYRHRGYPFAVIGQFDTWRRVQTADGTQGWMNASMLSDQRSVLVTGKGRARITTCRGRQGGGAGRSRRHRQPEVLHPRGLPYQRRAGRWLDFQIPHLGCRIR